MIRTEVLQQRYSENAEARLDSSILRVLAVTLALTGNLLPGVGGVSWAVVGLAVASCLAIHDLVKYLPNIHPVLTDVLALFTLLSVSLLWTDPPNDYGVDKVTNLITITLLSSLIALAMRDERDVSYLAIAWPIVMVPIAIVSLTGFEGGRAVGFDSNPIWVGRALSTGLIFMTWRVWFAFAMPKLLVSLGAVTLLAGALIATGSRGPILGLTAGVLILTLATSTRRFTKIAAIMLAVAVLWFFIFHTDFFSSSRLMESFSEGEIADSSGRDELLSVALSVIREHPEGVGIGNISNYWWMRFNYPHNIFIEVLAEHGVVVGSVFLLVTCVTFVRLLMKARHDEFALLLAALLAAEIANVSFSGDLNARTFFFFLTLSFWMLHRAGRKPGVATGQGKGY